MQAIRTHYLPCTDTKGARIKATCTAASITIPYPHEFSGQATHRQAAEALANKLHWLDDGSKLLGGQLEDGSYVFIFDAPASRD